MAYEKYMALVWFPWLLISCVPWLLMPFVFTIVSNHPLEFFCVKVAPMAHWSTSCLGWWSPMGRTVSWGVSSLQLWLTLCLTSLISIPWSGLGWLSQIYVMTRRLMGLPSLSPRLISVASRTTRPGFFFRNVNCFLPGHGKSVNLPANRSLWNGRFWAKPWLGVSSCLSRKKSWEKKERNTNWVRLKLCLPRGWLGKMHHMYMRHPPPKDQINMLLT